MDRSSGYDDSTHHDAPHSCAGRSEFDFQGNQEGWNLVWTEETRTYPWLFMFRNTWKGHLLHRAKFQVVPAVHAIVKL